MDLFYREKSQLGKKNKQTKKDKDRNFWNLAYLNAELSSSRERNFALHNLLH